MKLNKLWHQVGLLFFNYHNDARSNIRKDEKVTVTQEVVLQPAKRILLQSAKPKLQHTSKQEHNQCGDTIEKSQAPDDGCINVRNMLSIEDVKQT